MRIMAHAARMATCVGAFGVNHGAKRFGNVVEVIFIDRDAGIFRLKRANPCLQRWRVDFLPEVWIGTEV